jgi:hypothetical protein
MKDCITHYEYVCVYVDDLMVMAKDPKAFLYKLINVHKYKLKGFGRPTHHLGGDFCSDKDGTLGWGAGTYCKKLIQEYERMFGQKPKEYCSPLEKGDHPEVDTSEFIDLEGIKMYQSMIGALQWAVTLRRFDILEAVMTMSGFREMPRQEHLDRLKSIYGFQRNIQMEQSGSGQEYQTMKPSRCQRPMIGHIQFMGSNLKIYPVTCPFQEDYPSGSLHMKMLI